MDLDTSGLDKLGRAVQEAARCVQVINEPLRRSLEVLAQRQYQLSKVLDERISPTLREMTEMAERVRADIEGPAVQLDRFNKTLAESFSPTVWEIKAMAESVRVNITPAIRSFELLDQFNKTIVERVSPTLREFQAIARPIQQEAWGMQTVVKALSQASPVVQLEAIVQQQHKLETLKPRYFPELMRPVLPRIPEPVPSAERLTAQTYRQLQQEIREFERNLDAEDEVGLRLAHFGNTVVHVRYVAHRRPELLVFYGKNEKGQDVQLIQHYTRIDLLLVRVKRNSKPRRTIGFAPWTEEE